MAKIPENYAGKRAEVSYKLNPKIRIGGDPLRKRLNWVNRMDSEGSMNLSYSLVQQYNEKH